MAWSFTPDKPVYIQVAEKLKMQIISGEFPPGVQLPTVRSLAIESAVNPNTVQRAYAELEHMGIIVTSGTSGRFVTSDTEVIESCRDAHARIMVKNFVKEMEEIGFEENEIFNMIKEEFK